MTGGFLEGFRAMLGEAIVALATEVVCASCVQPGEVTFPGAFGDFGVCPRCRGSVTSRTAAARVRVLRPVARDAMTPTCERCRFYAWGPSHGGFPRPVRGRDGRTHHPGCPDFRRRGT